MFTVITLQCYFRYHTGSLAFGALILSIVQFIRIILEYLDHKLKGITLHSSSYILDSKNPEKNHCVPENIKQRY